MILSWTLRSFYKVEDAIQQLRYIPVSDLNIPTASTWRFFNTYWQICLKLVIIEIQGHGILFKLLRSYFRHAIYSIIHVFSYGTPKITETYRKFCIEDTGTSLIILSLLMCLHWIVLAKTWVFFWLFFILNQVLVDANFKKVALKPGKYLRKRSLRKYLRKRSLREIYFGTLFLRTLKCEWIKVKWYLLKPCALIFAINNSSSIQSKGVKKLVKKAPFWLPEP